MHHYIKHSLKTWTLCEVLGHILPKQAGKSKIKVRVISSYSFHVVTSKQLHKNSIDNKVNR